MHAYLNTAFKAGREASRHILFKLDRLETIDISPVDRNYYVTDVDQASETIITDILKNAYPNHSILGELHGLTEGDPDQQWVIDPLDGITNFIHGYPHFGISIAFKHKGITIHGLIYDPVRQELFTASLGQGAYLNDKRIRVSTCQRMDKALIGTGFPARYISHLSAYLKTFSAIFDQSGGIRRAGAAVLDMAYVAAGRLDGFWELKLEPWDLAAGTLIIQESGGLVSNLQGNPMERGDIIAGNPCIYKAMLKIIDEVLLINA